MKNNSTYLLVFALSLCFFMISINARGQATIINSNIDPHFIDPGRMMDINIMNTGNDAQIILIAKLLNSANQLILEVKSNVLALRNGMNPSSSLRITVNEAIYGNSDQAKFIQSSMMISSGIYHYCCEIIPVSNLESGDQYCEDIEANISNSLLLVYPNDKDTIEETNPILLWNHNEPFNVLAPGCFYRLVLVELKSNQFPEAAINSNPDFYIKNNLFSHQIPYPNEAKKLQPGHTYAWQVQMIANGIVFEKSDAWQFTISQNLQPIENKYATLQKYLDAGYYTVENSKIYFKFEEEYGVGDISFVIYNYKREPIHPKVKNDGYSSSEINIKKNGYNRFEINLDDLDIQPGLYTLEARNEKGGIYLLKFYFQ